MLSTRRAVSTALATGLLLVLACPGRGAATPPQAPTPTCQGLPVTVQGAVGTEGDDVMQAPLDAWVGVQGLGGNDTICLVDGTNRGSRDPQFFADAGPGDDVVVFQAGYSATVRLGAGSDRFVGNDIGSSVYTGASAPIPGGVGYFGQADTEADVVIAGAGRDAVYSGDTGGFAANPDRIATGDSNADLDSVFYAGRMTPDGELVNGSSGDLLFLVGTWPAGTLTLDDVAGGRPLRHREVLRWSSVRHFIVDERPGALRFVGGPEPDSLTVGDYQLPAHGAPMTVDVVTRGGGDQVSLAGALQGRIRLGGGHDGLSLGGACDRTRVELGSHLVCWEGTERTRTGLAGIDDILLRAPDVTAIGTMRADTIEALGRGSRVWGRGGPDRLAAHRRDGVVHGGRGRDRCSGAEQHGCELSR